MDDASHASPIDKGLTRPMETPRLTALNAAPLFGRRANTEEFKQIKDKATANGWNQLDKLDPKLCFVQQESALPLWNWVQQKFNQFWDGLCLRYRMYQKGFGFFSPDATRVQAINDVFTIRKYLNAADATKELARLKEVQDQSFDLKLKMMEKLQQESSYRDGMAQGIQGLNSTEYGVPTSWWQKPFAKLFPLSKGTGETGNNHLPEKMFPTFRVIQLDEKTLLTRTRLGAHTVDRPEPPAPEAATVTP